jgi:hypothetical protein
MEASSVAGIGAGSGLLGIILFALFKFCYKKVKKSNKFINCFNLNFLLI